MAFGFQGTAQRRTAGAQQQTAARRAGASQNPWQPRAWQTPWAAQTPFPAGSASPARAQQARPPQTYQPMFAARRQTAAAKPQPATARQQSPISRQQPPAARQQPSRGQVAMPQAQASAQARQGQAGQSADPFKQTLPDGVKYQPLDERTIAEISRVAPNHPAVAAFRQNGGNGQSRPSPQGAQAALSQAQQHTAQGGEARQTAQQPQQQPPVPQQKASQPTNTQQPMNAQQSTAAQPPSNARPPANTLGMPMPPVPACNMPTGQAPGPAMLHGANLLQTTQNQLAPLPQMFPLNNEVTMNTPSVPGFPGISEPPIAGGGVAERLERLMQSERNGLRYYERLAALAETEAQSAAVRGIGEGCSERARAYNMIYRRHRAADYTADDSPVIAAGSFQQGALQALNEENRETRDLINLYETMPEGDTRHILSAQIYKKISDLLLLQTLAIDGRTARR